MIKYTKGLLAVAILGMLAGCAGTGALPTGANAPVLNGVAVNKAAFTTWSTACNAWSLAEYTASSAIMANKISNNALPYIILTSKTVTPLCHSYPVNVTAAESQIYAATSSLAVNILTQKYGS